MTDQHNGVKYSSLSSDLSAVASAKVEAFSEGGSSLISYLSSLKRETAGRFTLIELLVVIAILAILAGMLLPSLAKAKAFAKKADCVSRMKGLGLVFQNYISDNNDHWPAGDVANAGTVNATIMPAKGWIRDYYAQYKDSDCPEYSGAVAYQRAVFPDSGSYKLAPRPVTAGCYLARKPLAFDAVAFPGVSGYRTSNSYSIHNMSAGGAFGHGYCGWGPYKGQLSADGYGSWIPTQIRGATVTNDWWHGRHIGTVNVLMFDIHVGNYTNKETYTTLRNGSNAGNAVNIYTKSAKGFK